jgi:hypothetical protein
LSAPLANNPPQFPEPPLAPGMPPPAPIGVAGAPVTPPTPPAEAVTSPRRQRLSDRFGSWMVDSGCWAWLSSAAVHAVLVIILSLIILSAPSEEPLWVTGGFDALPSQDLEVDLSEIPVPTVGDQPSLGPFETGAEISLPGARVGAIGSPTGTSPTPAIGGAFTPDISTDAMAAIGEVAAGGFEGLSNPLASRGGGLDGRTLENRRAAALSGGGTEESEAAVEAALAWFAEHQWPDGGWRFDLEKCPSCAGYCRNSGTHTSTTAATGLALLSFLGAGYTHEEGKYQDVVSRGLYYLQGQMTITPNGGDLRDRNAALEMAVPAGGLLNAASLATARRDSMYSHGIATLALTEAYAMTRDKAWREPAQLAVNFIVTGQYDDGGWRYAPKYETIGPGDMTVSGWQIMALKSATLAGLEVPYDVWLKINDFLDAIQEDSGATYLYLRGEGRGTPATTAIGLLCRMINGWPREHKPLQRGAAKLGDQQPSRNNMYFNYYASQVLHHIGGTNWQRWNPKMRDYLVRSQATDGHEAGSWYFPEAHSTPGGRLYTTAMATMTLEVYYRYMPMYKETFVDRTPPGR